MPYLCYLFLAEGPDAVKFIVNHANVQAIFCVAETLNSVSSLICCLSYFLFSYAYLNDCFSDVSLLASLAGLSLELAVT